MIELHTVLSFNLPFAIPVPDGIYDIKVARREAKIAIRRIQRKEVEGFTVEGGTMQIMFDKYGRSSFSNIQIKFPWKMNLEENGREPLLLGDIPPRHKAKETALAFVNRFIEVVRYITAEYWVERVRYQDILSYEEFYWDGKQRLAPEKLVLIDTGVGGIGIGTGPAFKVKEEKMIQIRTLLKEDGKMDIDKILILNAKDAALKEDFRLATIEAVTALETVLYDFIRKRGEKLGISNDDIERFIKDVGLTGNVKVVLVMLTEELEQVDEETLSCCKGAITTRNDILHKGLMEVPSTDTEKRILGIEKMISYLKKLIKVN
jgi:hypothetical protein